MYMTSGSGTFALIGARNTLALNLYYLKTKTLPDAAIPPTFITFNNNIQKGVVAVAESSTDPGDVA